MPYKQLSVVILVAFMVTGITCVPVQNEKDGDPHLETNIVFLSPGEQSLEHSIDKDKQGNLIVDPSKLVDSVQKTPDILEDPSDRFVTGRKGHVRLDYVDSEEQWAGEVPIGNQKKLVRVKRCGGGGGGGDGDGDANRSRRARQRRAQARNRRAQAQNGNGNNAYEIRNQNKNRKRNERRKRQRQRQKQRRAESQTTTKVIKVIEVPEGQTIQYQPSVQQHKVVQTVAPQSQKQVVHTVVPQQQQLQLQQQQQPIVHTVVPQQQQQQPIVQSVAPQQQSVPVQQQPAQQPAVVAPPPVAAAAPQPPVAAAAAPSISVQGSVKINSA